MAVSALVTLAPVSAAETPAASAPEGERVRIAYEAPAECAAASAFLQEVRTRLAPGWEAGDGELARSMDVRVRREDARYVATLRFTTPEGIAVRRVVAGKACDSVVTGVALVAALAIEARLSATPEEAAAEAPAPAPPAPSPVSEATPPRSAAPSTPPAAEPKPRSPAPPSSPWRVELGTRVSWVTGVGPGAALGPGAFVRAGPLPFELGLSFDSVSSGNERSSGVLARYELLSARLEGGAALSVTSWLELDARAFFEVGSLSAESVLEPPTVVRASRGFAPWFAPGMATRAALRFDPWSFGIEAMGRFPLVREQFYLRIDEQRRFVHRVPYFNLGVALMLSASF